jgi:iron transport multicopper oxidase
MFDKVPEGLNPNVTGWLVYDSSKPLPAPANITEFTPFDDFTLVPQDGTKLLDKVDYSMTLDMKMGNLGDGANYAFFNNVSYVMPKVPTLYTALSSGASATNVEIYGHSTNSFVLSKNDVVEIILNNNDRGKHPFHMHGHNYQVIWRSEEDAGPYDAAANNATFPAVPARRDTILVRPNGNLVLRFRADNPGIWLFHCHIEWHTASGLIATLIESPLELQSTLSIPAGHWDVCKAQNIPTTGNAAGNTVDLLDLTGEPEAPGPLPAGFTARGIVALVFSALSALLGISVIAWYGSAPITGEKKTESETVNGHAIANGSAERTNDVVEVVAGEGK